jgi:hypothetical protein
MGADQKEKGLPGSSQADARNQLGGSHPKSWVQLHSRYLVGTY